MEHTLRSCSSTCVHSIKIKEGFNSCFMLRNCRPTLCGLRFVCVHVIYCKELGCRSVCGLKIWSHNFSTVSQISKKTLQRERRSFFSLHSVLKYQVDRACLHVEEAGASFDSKAQCNEEEQRKKGRMKEQSLRTNNGMSAFIHRSNINYHQS